MIFTLQRAQHSSHTSMSISAAVLLRSAGMPATIELVQKHTAQS
jgi:hypothetical protein